MQRTGIPEKKKRTLIRSLIRLFSVAVGIIVFILVFMSPIATYLIKKYDVRYTGREVDLDWTYINPFTGAIYLNNPVIYEANSDTLALTAKSISARMNIFRLFSGTFDLGTLEINKPQWFIRQRGDKHDLNFKDLIDRFSADPNDTSPSETHFVIRKLKIRNGTFYYDENMTPVTYHIRRVNIESSLIGWGADTIAFDYDFLSGKGNGSMKGVFTINVTNLDYRLTADVKKYDLQFIEQYMKGFSNYGSFRANLDAVIRSKGSLRDARDLRMKGQVAINDMHFGKDTLEDYASFKKLSVGIKALYPDKNRYVFDTISLLQPYFKYERYDRLDNYQMVFGKAGSNVTAASANSQRFNLILEIAGYVEKLSRDFFQSYYKINKIEINKANFVYEDYSLNEKFVVATDPLFIVADSVDKDRENIHAKLYTDVKPYGRIAIDLDVDPRDSSHFDMNYRIDKFPLSMFNPYLLKYTSFPLERGTLEASGNWKVRNGNISSNNHLLIIDPRLGNRDKHPDTKWLPMRVIMALVREKGNVIDYQVPINGNLKKPKLNVKDAIFDLLKNLWEKPVSTPYRIEVKQTEKDIEGALLLTWEPGQTVPDKSQQKFIERTARFLEENKGASVSVSPVLYADKEKEYILFFEAKKKYYATVTGKKSSSLIEKDSMAIDELSIRDPDFTKYLNACCSRKTIYTIHEKCEQLIDTNLVNKKLLALSGQRKKVFLAYFKENGTSGRVKMNDAEAGIPFNGFSGYRIRYSGTIPAYLEKAYAKMQGFNNKEPRKKYKKKRQLIGRKT